MKTNLIKPVLLCASTIISLNLAAQQSYVSLNIGYGVKSGTSNVNSINTLTTWNGTNSYIQAPVQFGLGSGLNINAAFGKMINKRFGAEVALGYLLGSASKIGEIDGTDYSTAQSKGRLLNIRPNFVINTPINKSIDLITKFGVQITVGSILETSEEKNGNNLSIIKTISNGGIGTGFCSGLGIAYKFNDKASLLLELNNNNSSYAPGKAKVTEYSEDGKDLLGNLKTSQKEIDYVKELTVNTNTIQSPSEPRKLVAPTYNIWQHIF